MEGLIGLNAQGDVLFCNEALLQMTGYTADELSGKSVHELLHSRQPDGTKHPDKRCRLREGLDAQARIQALRGFCSHNSGTCFSVEYWVHRLPRAGGAFAYLITVQDVSAHERSIANLRKTEEKFRRILVSMPYVAWTSDGIGRTTYISPKVESILGYSKQELCAPNSKLWFGLIHPGDFGRVHQAYRALFEQRRAFDEEYRIRRKDGAWVWIRDRATRTYEENGILHADGIFVDVTKRHQEQSELQSKTAFLEAQTNATIDGILVVDANGRKLLNNQRFAELFNIPEKVLAEEDNRKTLEYVVSLTKDPEAFLAKVKRLYKHRDEASRDEIELKSGMILDRYSAPVVGKEGVYYGRIWTFRDITERKQSEDVLQQLSMAVEQSPVSVVITDPQGAISYVNEKFTEVTGYRAEEVLGRSPAIVKSGLTPPSVYQDLWSTITQGQEWRGEFRNRKKNGDLFWEAATIRPIMNARGVIAHYLAVKEDITERRRAVEELRGSRQMLQTILDAIPQRVFWKDRNCTYLGCNRPFAMDAGLKNPAEIVGKNDFGLSWASIAGLYRADDEGVMQQRLGKLNFQERQTRPDGTELWLQTNKLPLLDAEGNVTGLVGTYEDITERRHAEWELRLTKRSLDVASDTVFWINPQARIVYASEAASRALGYSREELISLSIPDIDPLFPQERWKGFWEEFRVRGAMNFESQHKDKQGRIFPVEVTVNFLEFDGQEFMFAFARDITQRRELESQLRQAQKLDSIGQLAAGIAHEINTPIQFVGDNLRFLRDSWEATCKLRDLYRRVMEGGESLPPPVLAGFREAELNCDLDFLIDEVPRAIEQALDGSQQVAKIVRAMKEFSHPGMGEKTAANLNQGVESAVTVARNEWKFVADVVMNLDETLPEIVCHPGEINQVILNLVVNATHAIHDVVKDGEKGRITIRTCARGEFVEISVRDTGTGIPDGIRTRIFDPFFTTKEVGKGTGQGLSLAHTVIVKKHGGKIWFETETGRGTTFFIHLPVNPVEESQEH